MLASVVKMAAVIEEHTNEEQRSLVPNLFVGKRLNAKYINKEMFPVYGGKCLSVKVVHNWIEKLSQGRSKVADDARPDAEVAEKSEKTSILRV
jgi:hypothetical protein